MNEEKINYFNKTNDNEFINNYFNFIENKYEKKNNIEISNKTNINFLLYDNDNEFIEENSESIFTLSNNKEIKIDKKIQETKKIIDLFSCNFFNHKEYLIFHTIYNYNKNCLYNRLKSFKEYVLIITILELFNIKIEKTLNNIIFNKIPKNINQKKLDNYKKEILSEFNFNKFIIDYNCENNIKNIINNNYDLNNLLSMIINGYILYFKNILILKKEYIENDDLIDNDIYNFKKLFNIDDNEIFCQTENLKKINLWFINKIKNLFFFNIYIKNNNIHINMIKKLEENITFLINVLFSLIILYKNNNDIKIYTFLIYNFDSELIKDLLNNNFFYIILKNHLKIKKINIGIKKFINILYDYLR